MEQELREFVNSLETIESLGAEERSINEEGFAEKISLRLAEEYLDLGKEEAAKGNGPSNIESVRGLTYTMMRVFAALLDVTSDELRPTAMQAMTQEILWALGKLMQHSRRKRI